MTTHAKTNLRFALTSLTFIAGTSAMAAEEGPIVKIDSGLLRGIQSGDVQVFRGIPYARPPIGQLRWQAPEPATRWKGIRSAGMFGPDCLQDPPVAANGTESGALSEDCLYLNVWRPARTTPGSPVLVWIHGGAFTKGGTSSPIMDGSAFARKGIVVVSLNYRLGRFGFFAHPALTAAGGKTLGNYGYADQIAALRWVRRNISAFGGAPGKVTLMGTSAGGISVLDLMASPKAQGLFAQAIVKSGGGRRSMGGRLLNGRQGDEQTAEETGLAFARLAGIDNDQPDALTRLRALPAAALLNGLRGRNQKVNGDIKSADAYAGTYAGGPIVDGRIKLTSIDEAISRGNLAKIPLLIGTTDGDLDVPTGQSKDELFADFGALEAKARRAYDPDGTRPIAELRAEITRDRLLVEPGRFVSQQLSTKGAPVWRYRFSYVPASQRSRWNGVPHGGDTAFFFDTIAALYPGKITEEDRRMAALTNSAAANFIRTGNPNGLDIAGWQRFKKAPGALFEFGSTGSTRMIPDEGTAKLDVIQCMPKDAIREP